MEWEAALDGRWTASEPHSGRLVQQQERRFSLTEFGVDVLALTVNECD